MRGRRAATVLALVVALSGLATATAPAALAACREPVGPGAPLPAAAGNEARSQPGLTWYPAAYDGVLAVAGVDGAGQASAESNRGAWRC